VGEGINEESEAQSYVEVLSGRDHAGDRKDGGDVASPNKKEEGSDEREKGTTKLLACSAQDLVFHEIHKENEEDEPAGRRGLRVFWDCPPEP
jgi:hypothetical protein